MSERGKLMPRIYICDDRTEWITKIENGIQNFIIAKDWNIDVICKSTEPIKILTTMEKLQERNGIYFIDVELLNSELDGFQLAQKIKKMDPDANLIFITTHSEMAMEAFHFHLMALDYILKDKDNITEKIFQVLTYIYNRSTETNSKKTVTLKDNDGYYTLLKDEIYYIETVTGKHYIKLYAKDKTLMLSMSLSKIAEILDTPFAFCSKSCIVNLAQIQKINPVKSTILLANNVELYASIRGMRLIKKELTNHQLL